jgi:hypothetical protein
MVVKLAIKGFGKALKTLKKDPSKPINPVKPTPGKKQTEAYLKKLKGKK